ncbi:MAG: hypothetical protein ACLQU9_10880 [Acidimicrobiales bacterium]
MRVGSAAVAIVALGGMVASVAAEGTAAATTSSAVSTTKNAKFGTILVSGKTVYTLKASSTPCTAKCLKVWPEVVLPKGVMAPTAGSGVTASMLGTVSRSGGVVQITYGGKPLYWFVGDKHAGQANGNITDKWGRWSVVVLAKPVASSTTGSTSNTGNSSAGTGGVSF